MTLQDYKKAILNIKSIEDFNILVEWAYHYQYKNNSIFKKWLDFLPDNTTNFLPIELFKSFKVKDKLPEKIIFTSSGTSGIITSQHLVHDITLYEQSFEKAFQFFYGSLTEYNILALLPAYLEREGSSLVYMADKMIQLSGKESSGFFLNNYEQLINTIRTLEAKGEKSILLGVSFALWDLAEQYKLNLKNTIVMETGGMKGRRPEITRDELHKLIKDALGVQSIHSEYGMTELLSQAYSKGNSIFECPPWMQIKIYDLNDPFTELAEGKTGRVHIIDLANIHSCSFIATSDLGRKFEDGNFEILGRIDNSDIRGCNLLVQ